MQNISRHSRTPPKLSLLCAIIVSFVFTYAFSQETKTRFALVIGVQSYPNQPLRNSLKDAHDMAEALRKLNFELIELYDPASKKEIRSAMLQYFDAASKVKGATGLIYYSGHGMQVDGVNYLIPTQANPQVKADVDEECMRLDYILEVLEQSGNALNILILDACRNNPFRSFSRSADRGLSMVDAPKGSYIVYATKPGAVASDGAGSNGLFTAKLLHHIRQPELNLWEVFQHVARDVAAESGDSQRPWIASDYTGDFYFSQRDPASAANDSAKNEPATNETQPAAVEPIARKPAADIESVRANVSIYRPPLWGIAVKCHVSINNVEVGAITNKGRMQITGLKYGVYNISFKYMNATQSVSLVVSESGDYYIRWLNTGPMLVDPESGKKSFDSFSREVVVVPCPLK